MNKPVWIVLLLVGLALLVYGIMANNSVASETSQAVTGAPTNKALWMMIGASSMKARNSFTIDENGALSCSISSVMPLTACAPTSIARPGLT